ncbi:pantetheine-phosphate adenylyltransferase [Cryptococcus wingfieldii CBS 7118]|uniref:Pantetheine-phosphate adenylyltransferase n=1 Tax=Cryptococcus wingfieldii CBS 7118 TaxID=1295528 RepID=A0A1E3JRA9_9TREE|nr:pantetheine-phosphate adenylyltransferase [Cryptococcus wingfieldii CBS 7118]ODO03418.1 pantetheine-phosphate adenylyltransferase [Cryptococcus wingfieldii CBS 7118]
MTQVDTADHIILCLPLTPALFTAPQPLVALILDILPPSASKSFTVFFSTPKGALANAQSLIPGKGSDQEQLYSLLQRSPKESFAGLQSFLGAIYTALWTAQWKCGKVLLDVEVHFEGEGGSLESKLCRGVAEAEEYHIVKIDGVRETDVVSSIDKVVPAPFTEISITSPSLASISPEQFSLPPSSGFPVVALGGTFDRLHAAHKLLLHLGVFLSTQKLIVGIMADNLLASKTHAELVQPLAERLDNANAFLARSGASDTLQLDVLRIDDALGPTRTDPDIQALVCSRETLSGGEYVNSSRKGAGLEELELFVVDVIAEREEVDLKQEVDEAKLKKMKMGSTGVRSWIAERGTGQGDR